MKSNFLLGLVIATFLIGVKLDVVTDLNGFCAVCISEGYQYCSNGQCLTDDSCPGTSYYTIDQCKKDKMKNYPCNKIMQLTSNDLGQHKLIEFGLGKGQWCQFMLSNAINNDKLRLTVANWSTNGNQSSTITVLFTETNSTDSLDSNLTQGIDLTTYW